MLGEGERRGFVSYQCVNSDIMACLWSGGGSGGIWGRMYGTPRRVSGRRQGDLGAHV